MRSETGIALTIGGLSHDGHLAGFIGMLNAEASLMTFGGSAGCEMVSMARKRASVPFEVPWKHWLDVVVRTVTNTHLETAGGQDVRHQLYKFYTRFGGT